MKSSIPINIEELLHGNIVETDRMEYKEGWNPGAVLRTICAFANDIYNVGGGYIIIGVESKGGVIQFPPKGIEHKAVDKLQQELLALTHLIQPYYTPIFSIEKFAGKLICVLWVPGGTNRPYQIPRNYPSKDKSMAYFVRQYASTVEAKGQQLTELISLTAQLPFDDRVCQKTTTETLSISLIVEYLNTVHSALAPDVSKMPKNEVFRRLQITDGPPEKPWPRNIGLLFFSDEPGIFLSRATLDVVWFPQGKSADRFEEKIFRGPLHKQLAGALDFIQSHVLSERVVKQKNRVEAQRFWNYPLAAIREAIVNSAYHKAYDIPEPIVVTIEPHRIRVHNFPGPERSISLADLSRGEGVPGRYRNRRIGDFLKELDLTEGRGTGIPKMIAAMQANGSPAPIFKSDAERSYFIVDLPIHPDYIEAPMGQGRVNKLHSQKSISSRTQKASQQSTKKEKRRTESVESFLKAQKKAFFTISEMQIALGYKSKTGALRRLVESLLERGAIEREFPDKPRSKLQRYRVKKSKSKS